MGMIILFMKKSWSSREILRILWDDGWVNDYKESDHQYLRHPTKPGKVMVTHPEKHIPMKTVYRILQQAGLPKDVLQTDKRRYTYLEP